MERGPLPPHERSWRHPSELAAEERALVLSEGSPRGQRVLALATGTLGLLAVGLLMVSISPKRADSPIAVTASTNSESLVASRGPIALATIGFEPDGGTGAAPALATPIGDGRFALITRESAIASDEALIDVRLPSGRRSIGSIVTGSDHAVVIALATREAGHAIAHRRPRADDIVTVLTDPPINVAYEDVGTLAVHEGTPVVDDHGYLVGICSRRDGTDHVRLIEVIAELDDATSVVP